MKRMLNFVHHFWSKCIFPMLQQVECTVVATKVWRVQVIANTVIRFAVLVSVRTLFLFICIKMDDHWAERSFLMTQEVLASVICWKVGDLEAVGERRLTESFTTVRNFVWSGRATIYFVYCTRNLCCQFILFRVRKVNRVRSQREHSGSENEEHFYWFAHDLSELFSRRFCATQPTRENKTGFFPFVLTHGPYVALLPSELPVILSVFLLSSSKFFSLSSASCCWVWMQKCRVLQGFLVEHRS